MANKDKPTLAQRFTGALYELTPAFIKDAAEQLDITPKQMKAAAATLVISAASLAAVIPAANAFLPDDATPEECNCTETPPPTPPTPPVTVPEEKDPRPEPVVPRGIECAAGLVLAQGNTATMASLIYNNGSLIRVMPDTSLQVNLPAPGALHAYAHPTSNLQGPNGRIDFSLDSNMHRAYGIAENKLPRVSPLKNIELPTGMTVSSFNPADKNHVALATRLCLNEYAAAPASDAAKPLGNATDHINRVLNNLGIGETYSVASANYQILSTDSLHQQVGASTRKTMQAMNNMA